MRIVKFTFSLLLVFAFSVIVQGQEEQILPKHAFELGLETYNFIYEEPDIDMKEEGIMYGLAASYTYHQEPVSWNSLMVKSEARYAQGEVDYDGESWTGESIEVNNIDDYAWELRGLAGKDFALSEVTVLTPYGGVGYRYLNDGLNKHGSGYERESNYLYSPVGVEIVTRLESNWSVGMIAEYDYFWSGEQKSHLSDAGQGLDDIENRQKEGYGIRASVGIERHGETIDLIIKPFLRYWNIDESEKEDLTANGVVIGKGYEPDNETTEAGLMLALRF